MSRFFLLYEEWETAERAAAQRERALSLCLDDYCEGTGPAPTRDEIAGARQSRERTKRRLRALNASLAQVRRSAPVI
jgi:hypothetical protein